MTRTIHRSAIVVALFAFLLSTTAALTVTSPAQAAPKSKAKVVAKAASGPALQGKLNLNKADVAQLRMLPGIGVTKAERIVAWRAKNGSFKRVNDLRRVKGFGRKSVKKLAPYLTVTGATTLRKGR